MLDWVFILKFIKFCIVGASGVIVDFGITYIFKEFIKINKYIANALGFACAASSNYILNRIWAFSESTGNFGEQYLKFIAIAAIGLIINTCIIYLLHKKIKWNFYFSKLCAIGVVTVWNFLMNYFFTF